MYALHWHCTHCTSSCRRNMFWGTKWYFCPGNQDYLRVLSKHVQACGGLLLLELLVYDKLGYSWCDNIFVRLLSSEVNSSKKTVLSAVDLLRAGCITRIYITSVRPKEINSYCNKWCFLVSKTDNMFVDKISISYHVDRLFRMNEPGRNVWLFGLL
jgi:hypothetical protein